jgi:hypothetical protein
MLLGHGTFNTIKFTTNKKLNVLGIDRFGKFGNWQETNLKYKKNVLKP